MPTRRPRHTITETDTIAAALDEAAKRWPAERANRSRLLQRLIAEGHKAVADEQGKLVRKRLDAIKRTRGSLTGSYPPGYLEDLRKDWPE